MLISVTILIGLTIAYYGVFSVALVFKYKNKPYVSYVRLFSTSSSALLAVLGIYTLRHVLGDGSDLPLSVSIAFTASIIIGFLVFFFINREKIR